MKIKSVSKLKRKADKVFSIWVRNRGSSNGFNRCVTCGKWLPLSQLQAGHYISRGNNILRYNEDNVWPQCLVDNVFKHGAMDEYALFLDKKFGVDKRKELAELKKQIHQFTIKELESIIKKYTLQE
jgi:hypothetical protein